MSDIIERLHGAYSTVFARSLAKEAAVEIKRRDQLIIMLNAEIKRLHSELEKLGGNENGIFAERPVLLNRLCSGSDDSDVEDWPDCF